MAKKPSPEQIKAAADRAEGARGVGRPTKYHAGYCNEVIQAGCAGLSLTAFAGDIGVSRATINNWMAEHPEFLEATKIHAAKRTLFLERGMLAAENGPQVTARIFALKNAAPEEWREKQVQEITGKDGGPIEIEEVSARELVASRIARLAARGGQGEGS